MTQPTVPPALDALITLARAAMAQGEWSKAGQAYQALLSQTNAVADEAYHNLALLAQAQNKTDLALQLTEAALAHNPVYPPSLVNRAVFLRAQDRRDAAYDAARLALTHAPMLAEAWHTFSFLSLERKAFSDATQAAREAVRRAPAKGTYHAHLANCLLAEGLLQEAHAEARQAVTLDSAVAENHFALGQVLRAAGYPDQACAAFEQALALKPDYTDAASARASALSVAGKWTEAWVAWEKRPYDSARFAALPRWQGEPVNHLLLHAEQGMGDALHFLRYLPLIRTRASKITLQVPVPLRACVAACFPDLPLIVPTDPLPAADAHGLLMSAPLFWNTQPETVPPPLALKTDPELRAAWRGLLAKRQGPQIGLVWSGNPRHTNDSNRSIPREALDGLIKRFAPHLVSLQNGTPHFWNATGESLDLSDAPHAPDSVENTLALMAELDLIVTIDSLPVHLAGSLQRPTWLMIPFDPDWRWLYGHETSCWYPTLRLFRQTKPKDWDGVLDRVSHALELVLNGASPLPAPDNDLTVFQQNPYRLDLGFGR